MPDVGLLNPQSIRIAVVFPAPLAPRKPNISPRFTWKEIWSTAVKSPKHFVNCSTSMTGATSCFTSSRSKEGGQRIDANWWRIRSGVSMPWICPWLMKAIRSHCRASSMMGVETTMVIPCSRKFRSICQNSLRDTGSTPVVGSSRNKISGLWIKAQLNASFCFIPPDKAPALLFLNGSICW